MKLKDIMTSDVTSINPNSSVKDAAQVMRSLNVGSVPVTDGNRPVGIITDRDITIRSVAQAGNINMPVHQVMTGDIVYGTPDMSVEEAAQIMASKQIRRLPVVENGRLVGIVSLGDLAVRERSDIEAGKALTSISVPSRPQK
ncbi:CBS domain-containing protein [Halothermothrix orenii]|uniref:Putative signal-transduction protein with CBS domains n=1 Tax=Halothermothrix orenii (strain H 168 / OCM 544 / DSM 9562) TaxID=373903 RepID=B8D2G4_HALOH|nr:CBS domain-containing protein [Halothermothrix orenii]ACL69391.1 putative signal-transduction protein with CBS domains [Halothermothrix orenii H 168]